MRLVLRDKNIGAAQGWDKDEELDPVLAGAGTKALGIHISREPKYNDKASQKKYCVVEDGMEYCDQRAALESKLNGFGVKLEA